jgi:hypothetical protein
VSSVITEIEKMRRALQTVKAECADHGDEKSVKAVDQLLANEMSVLRLAAILAPKN